VCTRSSTRRSRGIDRITCSRRGSRACVLFTDRLRSPPTRFMRAGPAETPFRSGVSEAGCGLPIAPSARCPGAALPWGPGPMRRRIRCLALSLVLAWPLPLAAACPSERRWESWSRQPPTDGERWWPRRAAFYGLVLAPWGSLRHSLRPSWTRPSSPLCNEGTPRDPVHARNPASSGGPCDPGEAERVSCNRRCRVRCAGCARSANEPRIFLSHLYHRPITLPLPAREPPLTRQSSDANAE